MAHTTPDQPIRLLGAPGSPYTRKMLAALRYRRIPHAIIWGSHRTPPAGLPAPAVKLLPTLYFPTADGGVEAAVDSSPLLRRLERDLPGRSLVPEDPALALLDALIEDYADEWLTKCMFHFRWAHAADAENAGPLLIHWNDPTLPDAVASKLSAEISKRQIDRLYVVGSNPTTAATIERSYARLLATLDAVIQKRGFVLGARPSTGDVALFGQLTQLAIVEPTSAAITASTSRRVRAWVDRVEDLSGLDPQADDWIDRTHARAHLAPLLDEIGRVYAPFLRQNAAAAMAGQASWDGEIDGAHWTQPTFPYQAKCLGWLRAGYAALAADDRAAFDAVIAGTGCEAIFGA